MSYIAQKRPFVSLEQDELESSTQSTTTQPQTPPTTATMTPAERRFCNSTIKSLKKNKRAIAFLNPVDPIAFNIPDYFDIIKHPMDLGTVERKLNHGQYPSVKAFLDDIQLIFDNCYLYNNAGDPVCVDANKLEESFQKLIKKAPANINLPQNAIRETAPAHVVIPMANNHLVNNIPLQQPVQTSIPIQAAVQPITQPMEIDASVETAAPLPPPPQHNPLSVTLTLPQQQQQVKAPVHHENTSAVKEKVELMPEDQIKRCEAIIKELKKSKYHDISWPFERPVDADAWGATDYYDIIKNPMDMQTIERKLNEFEYSNEDELAADIRLMFKNCYLYNPAGHAVNEKGHQFEDVFEKQWIKLHQDKKDREKKPSSTKKRRTSQKDVAVHAPIIVQQPPVESYPTQPPVTSQAPQNGSVAPVNNHVTANHSPNSHTTINHTTNTHTTVNHSATNGTSKTGSNILRLKLSLSKPKEEVEAKKSTTTPTKPNKNPNLALSKNPPPHGPKLAIIDKPPSPVKEKKVETNLVLQNHDQWLALAKNAQSHPTKPHTISKKPTAPYTHKETGRRISPPTSKITTPATRISPPPPPPVVAKPPPPPQFDITDIYSQIVNEKKNRELEEKRKLEKFERDEKIRLENERKQSEENMKRLREFNMKAAALREKERAERMTYLNEHPANPSQQKNLFYRFTTKYHLREDNDWNRLHKYCAGSLNYRVIPQPGFIQRSHIKLDDLRAKLLTKTLRLNSQANNEGTQDDGDSDMDVE